MYFTQEDYKKIENWLSKKSVKDSDFQEALPLNGEEIITVVQSGHNKKVKIREFIDKIYKYNGSKVFGTFVVLPGLTFNDLASVFITTLKSYINTSSISL